VKARATDAVDKSVGRQIRMRRITLGMSQTDLAEALGLTFQQVQKYEKGANRISAGRLLRLAILLEVPLTYFFYYAPGASQVAAKVRPPSYVDELMMTRSGQAMAQAFLRIKRNDLRRSVLSLVQAIAEDVILNH
jgi:transcriptional regulator with XRE-family HTH domain